jgi:hypothetical protein
VAVGANAGTSITTANNIICIGANVAGADVSDSCSIGNIHGASVSAGTAVTVLVDSDGKLGTMAVDANGNNVTVASPQSSRPQAALNEFRKQQKRIAELESTVARLAATVKEQSAEIQKVNARLEISKPETQVVSYEQ